MIDLVAKNGDQAAGANLLCGKLEWGRRKTFAKKVFDGGKAAFAILANQFTDVFARSAPIDAFDLTFDILPKRFGQ